ncbi:Hypothetical protein FKW44_004401 [Caligus rogercresseyi]|uniref:Uncharacterized protein n=1 Tax=Caligus rogercresseyi TaxID=217165 RepID=A0A7T8HMQ3_CALRO|nr:Hypothetical protein FKW44_004401 [Caligus rogercresseyi]
MQFLSLGIESSSLNGPSPQKNPKSPLVDGSLRRSESIRIRKMKKKSHAGGLSCLACQSCS